MGKFTKKFSLCLHEIEDKEIIEFVQNSSKESGVSSYLRSLVNEKMTPAPQKIVQKSGKGGIKIVISK